MFKSADTVVYTWFDNYSIVIGDDRDNTWPMDVYDTWLMKMVNYMVGNAWLLG